MRFFKLKVIPGWFLLTFSLCWHFFGVWARIEFILKKLWPNNNIIPYTAIIISSIWFPIFLTLVGLIWIYIFTKPLRLNPIYNKTLTNETVILDGNAFYDCTFNNVTYRWNGGPYMIVRGRIMGSRHFETNNQVALVTIETLKGINLLNQEFADSWHALPPEHFKTQ